MTRGLPDDEPSKAIRRAAASIRRSIGRANRLISEASVQVEVDVSEHLPSVLADPARVLQVFSNVVGNAIKFTPAGGLIRLGAKAGDAEVCFSVADTGPGIPSDQIPNLFRRFWQARRADRRGAGLGLPISKGIVEAHGGRIWVDSTPGQGSNFQFTLPMAPAAALALRPVVR
jgi:signal transduction histidine kinase